MLTKRSEEKELLDLGPGFYSQDEYAPCLRILFTINKMLGIFRRTVTILKRFPKTTSIIDVGCGGGLFLLNLSKYFPDMKMRGVDISEEAIKIAQNELLDREKNKLNINVEFQLQQQTELTLLPNSVDIVLTTLVCHHIEDDDLIVFLQRANNAACKAVIINDLQRHILAYWFYKILSPIFRNRLITHDGLISIKRSFTRAELRFLLKQANIQNYTIKWRFPFWWSIVILKE